MTKKKNAVDAAMEPKFTKEQLVGAKRFRYERDLVSALLDDGKEYAVSEVEVMITEYKKGKVK